MSYSWVMRLSSPLRSLDTRHLPLGGPLLIVSLSFVFAIMACAQDKPQPDLLIFKNGDQLTGTLLRGIGDTITFKSDMAGEITVSLDNVRELRTHDNFAVIPKGIPMKPGLAHDIIHPGTLAYKDATIEVTPPSRESSSVPETSLAFIIDQPTFNKDLSRQSILRGWRGSATAGASDVQATSYGTTFNAGLSLVRAPPGVAFLPPHDRTVFNLNEAYGKLTQPVFPQPPPPGQPVPASVAKTSIFHSDFEYDRYFSPRFYTLGDLTFDHNYSQGLRLQQVYGGGVGWTPIQRPVQQLDLKFDVHYLKQQFNSNVGTQNQNIIGSTFAETYRRNLPGKILLTESGSVLPAWNNSNAYAANGNLNLALPTFHRLTVNFGASDNFINDPPLGFQKNSFQFNTNLGYNF